MQVFERWIPNPLFLEQPWAEKLAMIVHYVEKLMVN